MMTIKPILKKYPSIGKGVLSGTLFSLSDAICQIFFQKKQFNWRRNLECLGLGLFCLAPCIQIWYSHLLPKITSRYLNHMGKFKKVLSRLAVDSLIYPLVSYSFFYFIKDYLLKEDRNRINYKQQIKQKFIPTLILDIVVWVPINFVNFWLMPPLYQGLYVGVASFFFNIALAYIANKELQYEHQYQLEQIYAKAKGQPVVHHQQSLGEKIIHKIQPKNIELIL